MSASRGLCSVSDCGREQTVRGLCHTHYARSWRKVDVGGVIVPRVKYDENARCSVDGCARRPKCIGMCVMHYKRFKKTGSTGSVGPARRRQENGIISTFGYVVVWDGKANYFKHRRVMEDKLGRKLFDHENVHHKNGVRHDNRIDNLELWSKKQPAGQRVADKIKWAIELAKQYPEFLADEGFVLVKRKENVVPLNLADQLKDESDPPSAFGLMSFAA